MLLQQINEMSAIFTQSNGSLGCSKAEYLMLYRLIKAGLVEEAMYKIAAIEDLRNKTQIQMQQANIQANAQQQQDSARVAEEEKRRTLNIKGAEDRKTAEVTETMEGIMSLLKQVLDTQNGENGNSVNKQEAYQVIATNQQKLDAIKEQDNTLLNPQSQEVPMQENQVTI